MKLSTQRISTLIKASTMIATSTIMLTACQATSLDMPSKVEVTHKHPVGSMTAPIADTGLSVEADSSFPIVELMPYLVKKEKELQLSESQVNAFAMYRKAVMKKRMMLQANEKALRGQLRKALIEGADNSVTTPLMTQISKTEMDHMELRRNCIQNTRAVLSEAQFNQLIAMYKQSLQAQ